MEISQEKYQAAGYQPPFEKLPWKGERPELNPSESERFMALQGLIQWTTAVITQADRIANAKIPAQGSAEERRAAVHAIHSEADFFVTAASRLIAYRKWVGALGLCTGVDFSELDQFDTDNTRDLRNMREHVVDYFQGTGRDQDRWMIETPGYKADASAMVGTKIGGRLDWKALTEAAVRLRPQILKEPMPRPA
jgi:hypothetical protein